VAGNKRGARGARSAQGARGVPDASVVRREIGNPVALDLIGIEHAEQNPVHGQSPGGAGD
jgi:hypothetical protein